MLGNATCEQSCSLTFSFSDIRIIGKGRRIQMKKIAHLLLGRFSIVAVSIILQFLWLVMVMYQFSYQFTYANLAIRTIAIIVVLVIVNRWTNPANKLSWTFIILLSPVLGLLLYMIFGRSSLTKKTQERMDSVNREVSACLYQTPEIKEQLEREDHFCLSSVQSISMTGQDFRFIIIRPQNITAVEKRCSRICLQIWKRQNILFFWNILS